MTNIFDEYPTMRLGDKVIWPTGADYHDAMGYLYYFGLMQMWDKLQEPPRAYNLIVDEEGTLCYIDDHQDEHQYIPLEKPVQNSFQIYIMDKIILNGAAQNRSDCEHGKSA